MTDTNDTSTYHNIDENNKRHAEGFTPDKIEWRRNKVMELLSHGYTNQSEISRVMQVPLSTINSDVMYLRKQAKENVARFTDTFAFEFDKCLSEANAIQRQAWGLVTGSKYERNKILALGLVKDVLIYKTELITNSSVVLQASNFIELKKKKIEGLMEQEGFGGTDVSEGRMLPQNVTSTDKDAILMDINATSEDINVTSNTNDEQIESAQSGEDTV